MSASSPSVNIPIHVVDMPPSPRSRLQQNSSLNYVNNNSSAKVNDGLRSASVHAPIPSMILQESAEDESNAAAEKLSKSVRRTGRSSLPNPNVLSHIPTAAIPTPALSATPLVQTVPMQAPAVSSAVIQVMLQLPGTNFQVPVNIPAETLLPSLMKCIGTSSSSVTGVSPAPPMVPQKPLTAMQAVASVPQIPNAASHKVRPTVNISHPSPAKVPRLSESTSRVTWQESTTKKSFSTISSSLQFAGESSRSSSVISDSDGDDGTKYQQSSNTRNAASRCRQKKKQQVEKMELKTRELQTQNKQLESEMRVLQQDIDKLQSLLSEHSECFAKPGLVLCPTTTLADS